MANTLVVVFGVVFSIDTKGLIVIDISCRCDIVSLDSLKEHPQSRQGTMTRPNVVSREMMINRIPTYLRLVSYNPNP